VTNHLIRSAGGSLRNKTEKEVLAAIKRLAVRKENTMVASQGLLSITCAKTERNPFETSELD
jgi:hypothetical protein